MQRANTGSPRIGYGDELWRLARERNAAALHEAARLLLVGGEPDLEGDYDGHRARAFAQALEGRLDDALATLEEGWTQDWPFPFAYATDVARVRYLAGDCEGALTALEVAVRGVERYLDRSVADLAEGCVRRQPRTWRRALKVAFAGGTASQQLAAAVGVVRARLARPA